MKQMDKVVFMAIFLVAMTHPSGIAKTQRVPCRAYIDALIDLGESHGNKSVHIMFQGRVIPPYKKLIRYQQVLKYGRDHGGVNQVDIGWCDVEIEWNKLKQKAQQNDASIEKHRDSVIRPWR